MLPAYRGSLVNFGGVPVQSLANPSTMTRTNQIDKAIRYYRGQMAATRLRKVTASLGVLSLPPGAPPQPCWLLVGEGCERDPPFEETLDSVAFVIDADGWVELDEMLSVQSSGWGRSASAKHVETVRGAFWHAPAVVALPVRE
jgi:hypothetical protein